jgi:hydroxyacylglutathione hydrolase
MGYDSIQGFLAGGMHDWLAAGLPSASIGAVTVQRLCHLLDGQGDVWILDVRSASEVQTSSIPGAQNIDLRQLPGRVVEVPRDRPVYVFCGSSSRATVAASLLKREGWENLTVVLGGLDGWSSLSCPLQLPTTA